MKNTKTKRLLSPSLRRHGIIYNHGLNKVAKRFGILNYLSAYNNNKIISENVGKSFCSLNSGSWLLVPDSRSGWGGGDELVNRSYRDRAADDLGHRDVTRNLSREL